MKKILIIALMALLILQGFMLRNCYLVIDEYNTRIGDYVEKSMERSEELKVINEQLRMILGEEIERREGFE